MDLGELFDPRLMKIRSFKACQKASVVAEYIYLRRLIETDKRKGQSGLEVVKLHAGGIDTHRRHAAHEYLHQTRT